MIVRALDVALFLAGKPAGNFVAVAPARVIFEVAVGGAEAVELAAGDARLAICDVVAAATDQSIADRATGRGRAERRDEGPGEAACHCPPRGQKLHSVGVSGESSRKYVRYSSQSASSSLRMHTSPSCSTGSQPRGSSANCDS